MIPEINDAIKKEFPDAVLSNPLPTAEPVVEEEGLSDEEIGLKPEQNEVVVNGEKPVEAKKEGEPVKKEEVLNILKQPVDYVSVESLLATHRKKSLGFLENNL